MTTKFSDIFEPATADLIVRSRSIDWTSYADNRPNNDCECCKERHKEHGRIWRSRPRETVFVEEAFE